MKILEVMPLDSRRKAILMRCDDKDHLVILGANSETVIESVAESPQDSAEISDLELHRKTDNAA